MPRAGGERGGRGALRAAGPHNGAGQPGAPGGCPGRRRPEAAYPVSAALLHCASRGWTACPPRGMRRCDAIGAPWAAALCHVCRRCASSRARWGRRWRRSTRWRRRCGPGPGPLFPLHLFLGIHVPPGHGASRGRRARRAAGARPFPPPGRLSCAATVSCCVPGWCAAGVPTGGPDGSHGSHGGAAAAHAGHAGAQ